MHRIFKANSSAAGPDPGILTIIGWGNYGKQQSYGIKIMALINRFHGSLLAEVLNFIIHILMDFTT
ncbi:hypothetical protein [Bacteroidetes bacterium endosymbiont of Geopemphigus sp.]|uniref:hypothetical protein n=1 Tax=Bacteroidetes bacterium endosymbiont of Geopemphigus sp. TaxID=2047937 RepID=UPI0018A7F047|nr:hypothetical protein [Bacteroidetes bacterium endosymbiont of Geopemphigus sp.]